jgi:ribonuclease VapC
LIAVDTSALVAIILGEPERPAFRQALIGAEYALVSTVSVVETRMVVHGRRGQRAVVLADDLLRLSVFTLVPPSIEDMDMAYSAFVRYEGSGHKADLNLDDVFSYALAKARRVPLPFKGNDFAGTNVAAVIVPRT